MKRILVATDLSEVTDPVLRLACELARATGAQIEIVHVAPPDPEFVGYDVGPDSVRDVVASELHDVHRQIQELASGLRDEGFDAKAVLLRGPAAEQICDQATRISADLVVVGSHGHGLLYRAALGSVSERVVRRASRPVLVVPSKRPES